MQTQNLTDILRHFPSLPASLIADQPCEATQAFVLYSAKLNFTKLQAFQQKCGENSECFFNRFYSPDYEIIEAFNI